MAKEKNLLDTDETTLSTNPLQREYLRRLVMTGMYGKNRAEAGEKVLADALEALIQTGKLSRLTDEEAKQFVRAEDK